MLPISIPPDVTFADLKLRRDPITGSIGFSWDAIERVCAASGIDVDIFRQGDEDNMAGLLVAWYLAHRASGGAVDAVAETLIAEVAAEDEHGEHRVFRAGDGRVPFSDR